MTVPAPVANAAGTTPTIAAADRVIVTYDAPVSATSLNSRTDEAELSYAARLGDDAKVYELDREVHGADARALIAELEAAPGVQDVALDMHVTVQATNDEHWDAQWGAQTGWGVNAEAAWSSTEGSGVVVGVVDTGIVSSHEDLAGQVLPGYDFISDVTTANDGDGWDNDASDPGDWETPATCGGYSDSSWHGTHVAGIIAAAKNNSVGVAGIAPGAKVLPVRALGTCGGSMSEVMLAMQWAAGFNVAGAPVNTTPAKVVNLSLGGSGVCPTWVQNAIDDVTDAGVLVVVAAGNENSNAGLYTPASCNNVLTVASVTSTGAKSSFSNWSSSSVIDLAAPGSAIVSTIDSGATVPEGSSYAYQSGTSMAAPHVAAVAALVAAVKPTASPWEMTTLLKGSATPFAFATSCSLVCGSGVVNAGAAVAASLEAVRPGAVQALSATVTANAVAVSWQPPASSGTSAISSYTVTVDGSAGCQVSALNCELSGLTTGSTHTIAVTAANASGAGPAATTTVTVLRAPGAPVGLAVTLSDTTASLSWVPNPETGGSPVTGYTVRAVPAGGCAATTTSCSIPNLVPGQSYAFSVSAQNNQGSSTESAPVTAQVLSGAAAPVAVTASASGTSATVAWSRGTGGLTPATYVATFQPSAKSCATTGTSCTVSGLIPGSSYSVTVAAVPSVGAAGYSQPASVTLPYTPLKVKHSSRTLLTKVLPASARGTKTWAAGGGCKVSGKYLIAPSKRANCSVTLKVKNGSTSTLLKRSVQVR